MSLAVYCALISLALVCVRWLGRQTRFPAPLPPGPPSDPIIGHVRSFPRDNIHTGFRDWARRHGDIMNLNVLGKHIIVLSSQKAASDLLEKKSAIYSSRPRYAVFELTGWASLIAFMPYGEEYLKNRKWFQQELGQKQAAAFQFVQVKHVNMLLKNLLETPDDYALHLTRYTTAVMLDVGYGPDVAAKADRYIELNERINTNLALMGNTVFLDIFPFLIHLPAWLPGLGCLGVARDTRKIQEEIEDGPFEEVRCAMAAGTASSSLMSSGLESLERDSRTSEKELVFLKKVIGNLLGAGTETTWSMILNFIAAMLLYPEAQKKAHIELDSVVGQSRLPDFSDRDVLPYVQSVIYETFRWHPPVPLGISHLSTADDIYEGKFIPKGSVVIANTYAIGHDENVYKNPHLFLPERFLPDHGGSPPTNIAYGYGRRICPGRFLADASVFLVIASILAAFEIRPALDAEGREVPPQIEFTTAITSHPKPFQCRLIPRSPKTADLIRQL